jgi:hypothetical protein
MEPPQDPPTLEYATPEEKPVTPTNPVVGILGFLVYGVLFLLLSFAGLNMAAEILRRPGRFEMDAGGAVSLFLMWAFCLWRAVAALRGALSRRK